MCHRGIKRLKKGRCVNYSWFFEGHTMGCLDIATDAAKCGARFITHLFNAMLPVIEFCLILNKALA